MATTSPAAVEIEAHVIRAIAGRAGLPRETVGHFTAGGAEANYTALICALTRANAGFAEHGARDEAPGFGLRRAHAGIEQERLAQVQHMTLVAVANPRCFCTI